MPITMSDLVWFRSEEFTNFFTHVETPDGEWIEIWDYRPQDPHDKHPYAVFIVYDDPEPGEATSENSWLVSWRNLDALQMLCVVNGLLNPDTYEEVISHGTENKACRTPR